MIGVLGRCFAYGSIFDIIVGGSYEELVFIIGEWSLRLSEVD